MRTLFYSAMAAACFGLLAVTPVSAENAPWTCMSPAFACGDAPVARSHRTAFGGSSYGHKMKKASAERHHKRHAKAEITKAKSEQRIARAEQSAVKPQAKVDVPERKDAQAPAAKQDKQASTNAKSGDTKAGDTKTAAVAIKPDITVRKVETEGTHRVVSTQTGMASYYWQGQMTASGVRFNPNAMTAAHRTLPFGTKVRVTNKRNGKSVVVTINDRGPFIRGRIIDLSNAAAGVIGMRSSGVAPVTVERIGG